MQRRDRPWPLNMDCGFRAGLTAAKCRKHEIVNSTSGSYPYRRLGPGSPPQEWYRRGSITFLAEFLRIRSAVANLVFGGNLEKWQHHPRRLRVEVDRQRLYRRQLENRGQRESSTIPKDCLVKNPTVISNSRAASWFTGNSEGIGFRKTREHTREQRRRKLAI